MTDTEDIRQPSEHERRVTEEMEKRSGRSEGPLGRDDVLTHGDETADTAAGSSDRPSYEEEVEAERSGTTADDLGEDEDGTPLDSAYRPSSG
ncbi:MAG TPA: hypothetical protein VFH63_07175 [candidate division Zixibacteria bacterium]|nr:hypothetical protein [candidate division Zixibacteria bacterium]